MVKKNEGNLKKAMNELLGIDGAEKHSEVRAGVCLLYTSGLLQNNRSVISSFSRRA